MLKEGVDITMFRDYMLKKTYKGKTMSESTYENYLYALMKFYSEHDNIGDKEQLTDFLIKYTQGKNNNDKQNLTFFYPAIRHYLKFKFGESKARELLKNLPTPITNPNPKRGKHFDAKTILKIINHFKCRKHYIIGLILIATGIRIGDCLKLKRKDIIEEEGILKLKVVGKNNKLNTCKITQKWMIDEILDFLACNKYETEYAFLQARFSPERKATSYVKKRYVMGEDTIVKIVVLKDNAIPNFKAGEEIDLEEENLTQEQLVRELEEQIRDKTVKLVRKKFETIILNLDKFVENNRFNFWADLKMAVKTAGYDETKFSCHDFRRCYAKWVWELSNHDIDIVQKHLNHSSPTTTLSYLRSEGEHRTYDKILQDKLLSISS